MKAVSWLIAAGLIACALPVRAEDRPDFVLPEPPAAIVVVEPGSPPAAGDVAASAPLAAQGRAASAGVIDLPTLPDAPVAFTADEQFAIALARRLAEDRNTLPPRLSRKDREGIASFYAARRNRPLWIQNGRWTRQADAVIARLRDADDDGMEPADYPVPALGVAQGGDTPAELAEAELRLGAAAALYARDARGGRIDPSRLSSLITPKLEIPSPEAVLLRLADATDAGAALGSYQPHHAGYVRLRDKLAELRRNRPSRPMVRVPAGPVLRLGMHDSRVPLIRTRFGLGPTEPGTDTAYDERVASAIADFQRERGLRADGLLTRQTIVALGSGGTRSVSEGDLIANMERWRWLPSDLGARYLAVNVPEFRLRVIEDGAVTHTTRVITGKPDTPTPIFSGVMDHAIVNPSWNIPPSILKNEFLPRMLEDPLYAEKKGFQVVRRGKTISIRQPPGERNALGFIKFMFPNQHAVYLHDTPTRNLFAAERRAFSHGCVRVEKPFELAEVVLGQTWSEERLKRLIGRGERTIRLGRTLPVHLTYFTVSVDEAGTLRQFDDLYGHNRRVRAALGLRS